MHRACVFSGLSFRARCMLVSGAGVDLAIWSAVTRGNKSRRGQEKKKFLFHGVTRRAFMRAIAVSRRAFSIAISDLRERIAISPSMMGE